ncbi:hypothetical protein MXB_2877 [Myxobolus squamalis]|nr:hypothetical protein MXB_2877 [Myxobolus squamalis]
MSVGKPQMLSLCSRIYKNNNVSLNALVKKYKYLQDNIKNKKKSIKDELRLSLSYTVIGVALCLRCPYKALRESVTTEIWRDSICVTIYKIEDLIECSYLTLKPQLSNIRTKLADFLDRLSIIYFYSILHFITDLRSDKIDKECAKFVLYFISHYFCVLGDIQKSVQHSSMPGIDLEFYALATKVWPRYGRPYQCLALAYNSRSMLFETTFYYTRSFLSMTGPERFSVALQDLGAIYDSTHAQFIKWNAEFNDAKMLENVNLLANCDQNIFLFRFNDSTYTFFLKNFQKPWPLIDYNSSYIKCADINDMTCKKKLYKIVFNNFIFSFLILNMKMINQYDLDNYEFLVLQLIKVFRFLQTFPQFFIPYIFNQFSSFAIIMIYSLEISLHQSCDDPESDSKSITIFSIIKLISSFTYQIVKLLKKVKSNEILFRSILKYLALIVRCFDVSIAAPSVQKVLIRVLLEGDLFFIRDLYNFLVPFSIISEANIFLPEFRMLSNSSFNIDLTSPDWERLEFYDDSEPTQSYLSYIWGALSRIIDSSKIFFRLRENLCEFDQQYFMSTNDSTNVTLKYSDFIITIAGICDDRLLIYLYNHVLNCKKSKESVIHFIQYVVPDTNTFLMEKNCIFQFDLFRLMNIAVPVLVVRELIGMATGRATRSHEKIAQRARYSFDCLKPMITKSTNVKVLSNEGKLTMVTENISQYHDATQLMAEI